MPKEKKYKNNTCCKRIKKHKKNKKGNIKIESKIIFKILEQA